MLENNIFIFFIEKKTFLETLYMWAVWPNRIIRAFQIEKVSLRILHKQYETSTSSFKRNIDKCYKNFHKIW